MLLIHGQTLVGHLLCCVKLTLLLLHEQFMSYCSQREIREKIMRLKELEGELQLVDPFKKPKVHLEQYATSAHIASHMIYTIDQTFDDIKNKVVADFGCGCGMLGIAASFLEADHILGFDIDDEAMSCAQENVGDFEMEANVNFLQIDICSNSGLISYLRNKKIIDTVVMNPPFGTKHNQGIDLCFVQQALKVASGAVYSLHKTATRDHILKKAGKDWNATCEVVAELKFDLPKSYRFHKKDSLDIHVDFMRFESNL